MTSATNELRDVRLPGALASSRRRPRRARVTLPVSRAKGGTRPGVNLDDSSAVLDILDGRR